MNSIMILKKNVPIILCSVLFVLVHNLPLKAQNADFNILNDFTQSAEEIKKVSERNIFYKGSKYKNPYKEPGLGDNFWNEIKDGKMIYTCSGKSQERIDDIKTYSRGRNISTSRYKDCSFKFEYRLIEAKKSSSLQILVTTEKDKAYSLLWIGFSADGNLLYSRDAKVINEKHKLKYLPIKYISEPCKSLRPVGEVNAVEVLRKYKTWFVVVNKDTVKSLPDEAGYQFWDSDISYMGPQTVEIDNVETNLYKDQFESDKTLKEKIKRFEELTALNGQYQMITKSCSKGSVGSFKVDVKFIDSPYELYMCLITGLADTPLKLPVFIHENKRVSLHLKLDYYEINKENYGIRDMYFSDGLLNFHISQVVEQESGGPRMMSCDLVGAKL
jgi:hypothetical protein